MNDLNVASPIIDVRNLSKSFAGRTVVNQLNLSVKRGEVFGFLGPNGSGKTTSIRMLCGLLTPDSGEGQCVGYDLLTQANLIKQHIGYMTQKYSFYTDLNVEENLRFVAGIYGVEKPRERIATVLDEMGLVSRRKQLTGELSGGWKQRVALAACLLHRPQLLLLDEPTAGIDPIARRDFWDQIHKLSEQGVTTLMSTHYMDEAERCTRLAYIADSELLITGSVDDVIAATQLKTWEIKGKAVTTTLLQRAKEIPNLEQAALFGRTIHLCGTDDKAIEDGLDALQAKHKITWQRIDSTLEDAFIHLVKQSSGGMQ